jgi:hypothetical protein
LITGQAVSAAAWFTYLPGAVAAGPDESRYVMADSNVRTPPSLNLPFLADLLDLLGNLRQNPEIGDFVEEVKNMICDVSGRMNYLGVAPLADIREMIERLANGESLDGIPDILGEGAYGKGRKDLNYLADKLRELDEKGDIPADIWGRVCRKWPSIFGRNPPRRAVIGGHGVAVMAPSSAEAEASGGPPTEPRRGPERRMSRNEAGREGRRLVEEMGEKFTRASKRRQANMIGCSFETWKNSRFFGELHEKKSTKTTKGKAPAAISLTDPVEADLGQGSKDEILNGLIADQEEETREDTNRDYYQMRKHRRSH